MRKMRDSGVAWIGDVPEGWGVEHVSRLATQVKNKNDGLAEKNLLSLSYGKVIRKPIDTVGGLLPQSFEGYNIVEGDDVVLRLTDLQNDQHSLRVGLAQERGIITSAYTTLRPREIGGGKYLYYVLGAFDLSKGFYGMGSGVRQGLNYDEVKRIMLPFPPLHAQRKIAGYLDSRCAEIDAAVDDAKRAIEEYKVYKKTLVFEAVTGKNIKGEKVPSGQDWLGDIPKGWRFLKSRFVFESVGDVDHYMPETVDVGVPYVMTGDLRSRSSCIDFASCKQIDEEDYNAISKKTTTKRGDVIFARYATIGTVCLVDTDARFAVSYSCVTIRPKHTQLLSEFLFYYLQSFSYEEEIRRFVNTNIQGNVGISSICRAKMLCPSLEEQKRIADMLDEKCGEIDAAIADKERLIADLETYKKSLIFEVVTGKREVA